MAMGVTDGDQNYSNKEAYLAAQQDAALRRIHPELRGVSQNEGIESIGQLRNVIEELPDNMPCFDPMGEPLMLTIGTQVVIS